MTESPYFDRLRAVAELNFSELDDDAQLERSRRVLEESKSLVRQVMDNPGISGEVKNAIVQRLHIDLAALEFYEASITALRENVLEAQEAMQEAKNDFHALSPELISSAERRLPGNMSEVQWQGQQIPVEEYLTELAQQRNQQRENLAQQKLAKLNETLHTKAALKIDRFDYASQTPHSTSGTPPTDYLTHIAPHATGPDAHTSSATHTTSAASPGSPESSGAVAAQSPSPAQIALTGAAVMPRRVLAMIRPDGVLRTATAATLPHDAQWPRDALHYPINAQMTADGPVGGYLPAAIADSSDPRWRAGYTHPALGSPPAAQLGIAGGILTLSAARSAGGATHFGPSGVVRLAADNTTAPVTAAGGTTTTGSAALSNPSVTSPQPPVPTVRPVGISPMALAGIPSTPAQDEKEQQVHRVGYHVVRLHLDKAVPVDPARFGAGDAASLRPQTHQEQDQW